MLSIIIPAYNSESTIENCILSILNQDYKDIEILAIDDGSSDNTLSILQRLSSDYPFIRVFTGENSGVSVARNKGLDAMCGDYFTFVDSDDLIINNIYKKSVSILENNKNIGMLTFSNIVCFDTGKETECIFPEETGTGKEVRDVISYDNLHWGGGYIWNRIVRVKDYWDQKKVYFREDISLYEDKLWLMDLIGDEDQILSTGEIGYKYFAASKSDSPEKMLMRLNALKMIYDYPGLSAETDINRKYNYASAFAEDLIFATASGNNELAIALNNILSGETPDMQQFLALVFKKINDAP